MDPVTKIQGWLTAPLDEAILDAKTFIDQNTIWNGELAQPLQALSNRLSERAPDLAFTLQGVAMGLLPPHPDAPELLPEIWAQIFAHRIAAEPSARKQIFTMSKATEREAMWLLVNSDRIKLRENLGFKTANTAIDYLIKIGATTANLSEYEVTKEELQRLFKGCSYLKELTFTTMSETLPPLPGSLTKLKINSPFLKKIQDLDGILELTCENCRNLESIPNLPNLRKLEVYNCDLKEIQKLDSLTELKLDRCWELEEISGFARLKKLICDFLPNLERIANLPLLEELFCFQCAPTYLSHFPALKFLTCRMCPILACRDMENLEEFNGAYSCKLREIPVSNKLKKLALRGCFSLEAIPYIESLEELACDSMLNLKELPPFPRLKKLSCTVTRLTELPELPSLEEVTCNQKLIIRETPTLRVNRK